MLLFETPGELFEACLKGRGGLGGGGAVGVGAVGGRRLGRSPPRARLLLRLLLSLPSQQQCWAARWRWLQ
jgi:hypothetical protein